MTPIQTQPKTGPGSQPQDTQRSFSLWRAVGLGVLLIPINIFWNTIVEVRWYTLSGCELPLFVMPVFLLFALVLLNLGWKRFRRQPGAGLRQEELLLTYIMLVISCTFCGQDTLQNLFGMIGHPFWFATPENKWQTLFFRFLPSWLLVTDHDALAGFYRGNVSIYSPEGRHYLASWVVPLAAWGAFFLCLAGMYLCLTVLVRRTWVENEKLTFPIIQLPLAITAPDAGTTFFRNPRMWAGFGLAFGISLLNGMHQIIPSLPQFPVNITPLTANAGLSGLLAVRPWNVIGATYSSFYPFAIGIAYFMPLDLSFSCWFFFVASRAFRVIGNLYGWDATGTAGFPYFGEQAAGAWLGLGVMLLYSGRRYWQGTVRAAWQGARADDPREAGHYRWAYAGLLIGGVLLAVFCAVIGMSGWVAALFFGIVFLLGFTITRVRAELGSPHEIYWINPSQVMVTLLGTHVIGAHDLTLISLLYWFNRCCRNHPMPNQLEAFKMMEGRPAVPFGGMVGAIVLAMLVSLPVTYWANLHVTYEAGAGAKAAGFAAWSGVESYGRLAGWLTQPVPPASTGLGYGTAGLLLTVLLSVMRARFAWWPFHPAGYALALSSAMEYFWLPVFLAWTCKFLLIRYGGVTLYRAAVPFFLGLILGDYTMGALWALIGPVLGIPTYKMFL